MENLPRNIIGIGDSFIHNGSFVLFNFLKKGLFFYNMAMYTYGPPQYNIVLKKYALSQKPDWILYGIYENDFDDTIRFEQWKKSGVDWVTYQSWRKMSSSLPQWRLNLIKHLPGIMELAQIMIKKYHLSEPNDKDPSLAGFSEVDKLKHVFNYITEAASLAKSNNVNFLCILIPARDVNSRGVTSADAHYEILSKMLARNNIDVLDLRPVIRDYPGGRTSLYNKIDKHWNRKGITVASEKILERISASGSLSH